MSECKISAVLPRILKERKMTQTLLAKQAGVSLSTLSTWLLAGARPRDIESVDRVASALGISLEELLFDRKPSERKLDLNSLPLEKLLDGLFRIRLERVLVSEFSAEESKLKKDSKT